MGVGVPLGAPCADGLGVDWLADASAAPALGAALGTVVDAIGPVCAVAPRPVGENTTHPNVAAPIRVPTRASAPTRRRLCTVG